MRDESNSLPISAAQPGLPTMVWLVTSSLVILLATLPLFLEAAWVRWVSALGVSALVLGVLGWLVAQFRSTHAYFAQISQNTSDTELLGPHFQLQLLTQHLIGKGPYER